METFEEILIGEVFLRPCLYNKQHPDKKKTTITNKCWREIAQKCGKSVDICKKKWYGLRDTFYRKSKNLPSGSGVEGEEEVQPTWQWYQQLLFLKDVNQPMPTEDNIKEIEDCNPRDSEPDAVVTEITSQSSNDADSETTITVIMPGSSNSMPAIGSPSSEQATLSYTNIKKNKKPKETLDDKWCKVIDKLNEAASTEIPNHAVAVESSASLFGKYVASEMEKMKEEEQDSIKFAVFDAIQMVKRARHN